MRAAALAATTACGTPCSPRVAAATPEARPTADGRAGCRVVVAAGVLLLGGGA